MLTYQDFFVAAYGLTGFSTTSSSDNSSLINIRKKKLYGCRGKKSKEQLTIEKNVWRFLSKVNMKISEQSKYEDFWA